MEHKETNFVRDEASGTVREESTVINDTGTAPVREASVVKSSTPARRAMDVVYLVFGIIDALLVIRLVLKLLGANAHAGFASFTYGLTDFFLAPRILVAGRITIANLGAACLRVAQAFVGVRLHHLACAPVFVEQLRVGSLGFRQCRVLPILGARRHLGAFGLVQAVLEDISESVVGILDQRKESLASQLRSLGGETVVLQLEETADDLLFAPFFHARFNSAATRTLRRFGAGSGQGSAALAPGGGGTGPRPRRVPIVCAHSEARWNRRRAGIRSHAPCPATDCLACRTWRASRPAGSVGRRHQSGLAGHFVAVVVAEH